MTFTQFRKYLFFVVVGIIVFNLIGWPFKVRFNASHLNYFAVTALCLLLPISMILKFVQRSDWLNRLLAVVITLSFGSICFFIGMFAYTDGLKIAETGVDKSFELIEELEVDSAYYRLYRVNGGATTSWGLNLRKEYQLPIGIKLVSSLLYKDKAYEAEIKASDDKLLLIVEPYSEGDSVDTIELPY